jgi:hypothetical protein
MKVFLLHRDRDFEVQPELRDVMFEAMLSGNLHAISNAIRDLERRRRSASLPAPPGPYDGLAQDLDLETLWNAMYRQHVLADCLERAEVVRQLYRLAIEALASEQAVGSFWNGARADWILSRSVRVLKLYLAVLRRLRQIADEHGESFRSEGFGRFFAMVQEELGDDYFDTVEQHLRELELKRGVLESAELGKGDTGTNYLFHQPRAAPSWKQRVLRDKQPPSWSFELHPRDEAGFRSLAEIKARGSHPSRTRSRGPPITSRTSS